MKHARRNLIATLLAIDLAATLYLIFKVFN